MTYYVSTNALDRHVYDGDVVCAVTPPRDMDTPTDEWVPEQETSLCGVPRERDAVVPMPKAYDTLRDCLYGEPLHGTCRACLRELENRHGFDPDDRPAEADRYYVAPAHAGPDSEPHGEDDEDDADTDGSPAESSSGLTESKSYVETVPDGADTDTIIDTLRTLVERYERDGWPSGEAPIEVHPSVHRRLGTARLASVPPADADEWVGPGEPTGESLPDISDEPSYTVATYDIVATPALHEGYARLKTPEQPHGTSLFSWAGLDFVRPSLDLRPGGGGDSDSDGVPDLSLTDISIGTVGVGDTDAGTDGSGAGRSED
jgi:hypothetical protein